jgi:hypothetical protein
MFISNMLNMSHRHIVPFIRSKTTNITKEIIRIEREKTNNKLMKLIIEKDTLRYKIEDKNHHCKSPTKYSSSNSS